MMSLAGLAAAFALSSAASATPFQPWINGVSADEPAMQVQRLDADTYVIRQSIRTNFEGPFLYLLFGQDRALLLDSGAGGVKIRPTIDHVIAEWLADHRRRTIPLILAHSHGHGDHHQGDAEFSDRPDTTLVGLSPGDVAGFFKLADWPDQSAPYDLGGRILDIIPTPGHQAAHIMVYDARTQVLFSGDAIYPGRLYFPLNQFNAYRDSIDRIAAFTRAHAVSYILGAHIEMTAKPGVMLVDEAPSHPDEHVLELPPATVIELQAAIHAMGDTPRQETHRDFIIFPLPARP